MATRSGSVADVASAQVGVGIHMWFDASFLRDWVVADPCELPEAVRALDVTHDTM